MLGKGGKKSGTSEVVFPLGAEFPNTLKCLSSSRLFAAPRRGSLSTFFCLYSDFEAVRLQDAFFAFGLAGEADIATVQSDGVSKPSPLFAGHERHQIPLNLFGLLLLCQAQPSGDALDMGVYRDAFLNAEGGAQDDGSRFAPDAGQLEHLVHLSLIHISEPTRPY